MEGVANGTIVATEAPVDSAESQVKTDTITRQSTYTPAEKDTTTTTPTKNIETGSDSTTVAKTKPLEGGGPAKTPETTVSESGTGKEVVEGEEKSTEGGTATREEESQAKAEPAPTKETPQVEKPKPSEETTGDEVDDKKAKVNRKPGRLAKQDTTTTEAHPRAVPETKATVGDMDPNAIVGEGEGVTFAFKHQLEADPKLGKALADQIGYGGKIGTKAFYEALGKEFGYIKPNGEWIGVSEGDVAAYKFVKVGDSYKVYEYHLKGTEWEIVERHKSDGDFEGEDYEREYEYLNTPKRKPEVADGDGDEATEPGPSDNNGQLARKPKADEGDLNNGQLNRAPKPGSQNLDNGQLARKTGDGNLPRTRTEDNASIRTKTVSKIERIVTPAKGPTTILESDKQDVKWTIEPGPPDGRPWIVEDFKLVGGKALRMFADRYGYDELTNSQVKFVGDRYRFNLNKIFEKSSDWTDKWSKEPATRLLRMDVGDKVSGNKEELSAYIKMLNKATDMKPFNDGFVGNKETTKDYILRMLFELEKRGKLDAFNDKFDAFVEGASKPEVEVPVGDVTDQIDFGKVYMYELWQRYSNTPESLSEDELAFVEKTEALGKKLDSKSTTLEANETAEHYMKRLEGLVKSKSK